MNAKEATHRVQFQFVYGIFRQFVLFTLVWLVSMPLLFTSMFQAEWHTASHEHLRSLFCSPIGWNRHSFTSSIFDPLFELECLHPAFFGIAVNVLSLFEILLSTCACNLLCIFMPLSLLPYVCECFCCFC